MADRAGWQRMVESELRAVGRELEVPPAGELTSGNTLIWDTGQVALRLEGNLGQATALAIADSAR